MSLAVEWGAQRTFHPVETDMKKLEEHVLEWPQARSLCAAELACPEETWSWSQAQGVLQVSWQVI